MTSPESRVSRQAKKRRLHKGIADSIFTCILGTVRLLVNHRTDGLRPDAKEHRQNAPNPIERGHVDRCFYEEVGGRRLVVSPQICLLMLMPDGLFLYFMACQI